MAVKGIVAIVGGTVEEETVNSDGVVKLVMEIRGEGVACAVGEADRFESDTAGRLDNGEKLAFVPGGVDKKFVVICCDAEDFTLEGRVDEDDGSFVLACDFYVSPIVACRKWGNEVVGASDTVVLFCL